MTEWNWDKKYLRAKANYEKRVALLVKVGELIAKGLTMGQIEAEVKVHRQTIRNVFYKKGVSLKFGGQGKQWNIFTCPVCKQRVKKCYKKRGWKVCSIKCSAELRRKTHPADAKARKAIVINLWRQKKYKNDPVFREKVKAYGRRYWRIKKLST